MKKLVIILLSCSTGFLIAQVEIPSAPQWQLMFHVTDEGGMPIPNANVYAGYYVQPSSGRGEAGARKTGVTDTNGLVTLTAHTGPSVGYGADKPGYYSTSGLEYRWKGKADNKWQPWNAAVNIVLKRIVKPIPMYAKSVNLGMPVFDKPAGFDFELGDWVRPYGKGVSGDIIFTAHLEKRSRLDFDYKLTVSFLNRNDGIQIFAVPQNEQGSELRSSHEVPTSGYQPESVREHNERPNNVLKYDNDPNRIYLFRVRTVLDESGNIKSALYGKIYGDFMNFRYYLNPTPNDRNVEFDPKQNLMKNLKPGEGVNEP